jgi:hypothetical protein
MLSLLSASKAPAAIPADGGEADQNHSEAASVRRRSNRECLLAAIREFFKNNPSSE